MGAVQRTIEQVIADAWGNDDGGVTVHVLEEGTHLEVQRALTPDEARAFAEALVLAADAVEQGPCEPPAPRGDAISASGDRRTQDVAKAPQIAAEAQQGRSYPLPRCYHCGGIAGHYANCPSWTS